MENNLTKSLNGLNAIICGATSGIGKAAAIELSSLGANITLFARNEDKLRETLSILACNENQSHQYLVSDFDKSDRIKKTIENHVKDGRQYHILVNNSGGLLAFLSPLSHLAASSSVSAVSLLNFSGI